MVLRSIAATGAGDLKLVDGFQCMLLKVLKKPKRSNNKELFKPINYY